MCHHHVGRRAVLAGAGTVATAALAGCTGGGGNGEDVPEPITLTSEHTCDVCGMVVPNHPGPSAEIFYRDEQPGGHANPARFDSTWEAFQFDFDRRDRGWERVVFYVTDYSAVEYELFEEGGDTLVSTHPEASAFTVAERVTFVVDSAVKGAMGRDLVGFSSRDDAESFRADHGGDLLTLGDVTREVIAQLGRE
jgi:nitrous oxide reductase accessory protein NosL